MNAIKRLVKLHFPGLVALYRRREDAKEKAVRVRRWKKEFSGGGLLMPRTIYLETTSLCNAACVMCPHRLMKRPQGIMAWELFEKIVKDCRDFEGAGITFYLHKDGEPLMDPLLFRRIKLIKEQLQNSRVAFNTNASLLDEDKAVRLLDSGADAVTFSVDAASAEAYEKIRPGLKYSVVKENLDRFFELRKTRAGGISATMQMVVCEATTGEVEAYRKLWQERADKIFFKAMHNFLDVGTSIKTKRLSGRQLNFCAQPFDRMMVQWNGDLALCCWDYDNFLKLGNVGTTPLLEAFNNAEFTRVRRAMAAMDCGDIVPCNRCSQIYGRDIDMEFRLD